MPDAVSQRVFAEYVPPFELTSDMLFAAALAPAGPLRRAFPQIPFLTLAGRVPLAMWFSRITGLGYGTPDGGRAWEGGPDSVLYNELNIVALERRAALFVPGIYATSERTIRVGHGYGMPKEPTQMTLQVQGPRFVSDVRVNAQLSLVHARLLGRGSLPARLLAWLWPRWVGPVEFPAGDRVKARIDAAPRVQLARIQNGRLALGESWLPDPVPLLPLGLYVTQLRMTLPPPPGVPSSSARAAQTTTPLS